MNILNKVTIKTLSKNRVRTLVTIIGIILSAAMFTAVTTSISSLQHFLYEVIVAEQGNWHGAVYNLDKAGIEKLKNDSEVEKLTTLQNIGYAKLTNYKNENKPFLFIGGIDSSFTEMLPVYLKEGRLPQNENEIILPFHLATNGGIKYKVGDTLELDIGQITVDGQPITQKDRNMFPEDANAEFTTVTRKTYQVVGIYERPSFEYYTAPGYTALTLRQDAQQYGTDVYFLYKNPKQITAYLQNNFKGDVTDVNSDLLRTIGAAKEQAFNTVLYSMGTILIFLIMIGSISLIYNAFSISVSERTKQFGVLASVGATRRQLIRSVLTEASVLNIIGIPIGILAGIAGIEVTFLLCEDLFKQFLNVSSGLVIKLHVSWEALAIAAFISIVTVLISAYIPAKRAMRVSVIDAIRQTQDIKIKPRKVRTSKLTYKLFGFEGMVAAKNFKRNKRKYRATVISLFMSVVLFISASSFSAYVTAGATSVVSLSEFDLGYTLSQNDVKTIGVKSVYERLANVEGVSKAGYTLMAYERVFVPSKLVSKDYINYFSSKYGEGYFGNNPEEIKFEAYLYFIQDDVYKEFLTANNLDLHRFLEADVPEATAIDFVQVYDGKYYAFNALTANKIDVRITKTTEIPAEDEDNTTGEEDPKIVTELLPGKIGAVVKNAPFLVTANTYGLTLLYPYSKLNTVLGDYDRTTGGVYFQAENHKAVYEKMSNVLLENDMKLSALHDYADSAEAKEALITVLNVFSYGFIVLISLIAAANVFNTISTNIYLRRRELAMLKSIGMTRKGFRKMMNFECLLYGIKGLIYGLPVSFLITYWIFKSISAGWESRFFIPWQNVAIAVGSVFAVVFATMLYSMQKIKKDNLIDALRNENL